MSHYQHLLDQLKQLRLGGLLDSLEVRLKEAEKRQLAYVDFLTLLVQDELERRSQTKFVRRLKKACFAEIKTLEEFDFGFNPNIKRRRIYDLATCRFLENKENICLCGPVGVGKSSILALTRTSSAMISCVDALGSSPLLSKLAIREVGSTS